MNAGRLHALRVCARKPIAAQQKLLQTLSGLSLTMLLFACAHDGDTPAITEPQRPSLAVLEYRSVDPLQLPAAPDASLATQSGLNANSQDVAVGKSQDAAAAYAKLIAGAQSAHVRTEAQRRLADLLLHDAELRLAAGEELTVAGEQGVRANFLRAVELYEAWLRASPAHADRAAVYYQLAKAQDLLGERRASLHWLDRLNREFPADHQGPEAAFRRGEAAFVLRDWALAEQAYSEVLAGGRETPFHDQAFYKRGWARLQRFNHDAALDDFFTVLERLRRQDSRLMQVQNMREDTERVIAISFAAQDGPDSAREWFSSRLDQPPVRDHMATALRALAQHYLNQQRYADAVASYACFVGLAPLDDEAPAFSDAQIDVWRQGGFADQVLEGKREFVGRYGHDSAFMQRARPRVADATAVLLKRHLGDVIDHAHARAQTEHKPDIYLEAAALYEQFLRSFPGDPELPQRHFLMAEALLAGKQEVAALRAFEAVAFDYPLHARSEPAAWQALVLAEKNWRSQHTTETAVTKTGEASATKTTARAAASGSSSPSDQTRAADAAENDRSPALAELRRLGERYLGRFADSPRVPGLWLSMAEWALSAGDLEQVSQAAANSLQASSGAGALSSEQSRRARRMLADAEFDLQRYDRAEAAYQNALQDEGTDARQRQQLETRRAQALYKQGEAAAARADRRRAVEYFLAAADSNADVLTRAVARYDAAQLQQTMQDWPAAITSLRRFLQLHGDHALAGAAREQLALVYEAAQRPADAARVFAELAARSTDAAYQRRAGLHVANLYRQAGDAPAAIAAWSQWLQRFASDDDETLAVHVQRLALVDAGQKEGFENALLVAVRKRGASAALEVRTQAAELSFRRAEAQRLRFESLPLKQPLQRQLRAKREAMDIAMRGYEDVQGFAVQLWQTAASHRLAELHARLASDLLHSEMPAGMSEAAREEYQVLLEEQALPFEEEALVLYERNLQQLRAGVINEWTQASLAALAKLMPARYGAKEDVDSLYQ